MFSANENIMLRQYKRRIIEHVEECIPEEALDLGTSVMVMQVSCKAPGCVPLETLICVVFPKNQGELIPNLEESSGGTFKTKVLKPMAEVSKQDVLEALPPEFPGGQRSMEKLCLQARDVMLGQITQIVGEDDLEGKELMVHYLRQCLTDYLERGCVAPAFAEPFGDGKPNQTGVENGVIPKGDNTFSTESNTNERSAAPVKVQAIAATGNFVVHRPVENDAEGSFCPAKSNTTSTTGNFVVHRSAEASSDSAHRPADSNISASPATIAGETATDWRRRQNIENTINLSSQQNIIASLAQREHAPGIRRAGCPCCDPDNTSNFVNSMMML